MSMYNAKAAQFTLCFVDAFWMLTLCVAMVAGGGSSGSLSLAQPAPPLRQVLTPRLVLQAPPLRQVLPPLLVLPPPPPRQVLPPLFDLAAAAASALNLHADTSFVAAAAGGHVAATSFRLTYLYAALFAVSRALPLADLCAVLTAVLSAALLAVSRARSACCLQGARKLVPPLLPLPLCNCICMPRFSPFHAPCPSQIYAPG